MQRPVFKVPIMMKDRIGEWIPRAGRGRLALGAAIASALTFVIALGLHGCHGTWPDAGYALGGEGEPAARATGGLR